MTFEHEIMVGWGDCDPAKIAYTGRIPNWCLDSINAFLHAHLGGGWFVQELDNDMGMPFVHMSIDFRAPVTPRHPLICRVFPTKLGTASVTFQVEGFQNGTLCFQGTFVEVVTVASTFEKQTIPAHLRRALEAHLPS
ncbi:thioesterase family protein [Maritimibacter sp. DP1N21-5]|uniref:acyl-CoA thioesterase n=1 Tax=Maritimibacter sp. DP1N21-5 TaxID=2836867 RepID=UPI001C4910E7|nr:thioesterase family protein [Maritimibacter sp. DP1N21-5]MBV7407516.1 acyl-CoA thioesterase [Maritimibacter sp. DP1N21-5]